MRISPSPFTSPSSSQPSIAKTTTEHVAKTVQKTVTTHNVTATVTAPQGSKMESLQIIIMPTIILTGGKSSRRIWIIRRIMPRSNTAEKPNATSAWKLGSWFGLKTISINHDNGVLLEIWTDVDATGNWVKTHSILDNNDWRVFLHSGGSLKTDVLVSVVVPLIILNTIRYT